VEAQRALVCQRLGDLSRSGAELCARAGLAAAAAGCYDGRPPRPLESCRTPPARARRRAPAGPPAGRAAAWLSADRLLVAAGAAGLFLAWRAAARRRGPGVRSPRAPAALPWGADARFPGGPRFLNE